MKFMKVQITSRKVSKCDVSRRHSYAAPKETIPYVYQVQKLSDPPFRAT